MLQLCLIQTSFSQDAAENMSKVCHFLEKAHKEKAQVALIPELFLSHYFCKTQKSDFFALAHEVDKHPHIHQMKNLCKKLGLVVPFSFYEKSGVCYYNSVAMIDGDGQILGIYRKSHIPDGPGYQEKFYFRPGNTGFMVFNTQYARLGVGICWDQWFSEAARIMTLKGADILLYPTAIGSEPDNPSLDTKNPWQRVMQGHAVSNMIPVAAANRIGVENGQSFYGSSFVCDEMGEIVCDMALENGFKVIAIDLERAQKNRTSFGFFRDRRPDLYGEIMG